MILSVAMEWTQDYHLFLFDFDGLLIDSEALHLEAYKKMCAERGLVLELDVVTYNRVAQFDSTGPMKALCSCLPELKNFEWSLLRRRKNEIYEELLGERVPSLMPGVETLLTHLEERGVKKCVVTHSSLSHVEKVRQRHPLLETIAHWITREEYSQPKPDPECYRAAVARYGMAGERVIGFEDSPKGVQALLAAGVESVCINPYFSEAEMREVVRGQFRFASCFEGL